MIQLVPLRVCSGPQQIRLFSWYKAARKFLMIISWRQYSQVVVLPMFISADTLVRYFDSTGGAKQERKVSGTMGARLEKEIRTANVWAGKWADVALLSGVSGTRLIRTSHDRGAARIRLQRTGGLYMGLFSLERLETVPQRPKSIYFI